MASIIKIGDSWRAQVRRKGYKHITESFPTKAQAQKWARKVEAEIDEKRYQSKAGIDPDKAVVESLTIGELVQRYIDEIGAEHPFGRNKTAVLASWQRDHGGVKLSEVTDDFLTQFVRDRRAGGAGGVTINIDLTYLATVFKTAKDLWKIQVSQDPFETARARMAHLKISTRAKERERRPTPTEIDQLCDHFDYHTALPMRDIIHFAIETAMRLSEIVGLRWPDLNEERRTIIIRDRKHPRKKIGNDQEVPLLGNALQIAQRQPRRGDLIFPYRADTISTIFPRACRHLKIVDLHFHDFRHEGVSRLFEQGLSIMEVSLISGHRSLEMLKRYTNLKATNIVEKYGRTEDQLPPSGEREK